MNSPGPSQADGEHPLYGVVRRGINRRMLLGALAALPVSARAAKRGRIGLLRWHGQAKVFAGGRTVEIGVRTEVEPFVRARSDSWLLSDGPGKRRTMVIEPQEAFIERDGKREPMPEAMATHERQQFAVYGYMLGEAEVVTAGVGPGRDRCTLQQADFPPAVLHFNRRRMFAIDYTVSDPETGAPIAERFTFAGEIGSNGVRWPRVIRIDQNSKPYFELTLSSFEAIRA